MKVTYKCVDVGMISAVEARVIVLNQRRKQYERPSYSGPNANSDGKY